MCGSLPPSARSCSEKVHLLLHRPLVVDTSGEPADSAVPTAHTDWRPGYDPAPACPRSSNDACPILPSSWLCCCRIVESSPMRYPVTTGALGRPRRLGCIWRFRSSSAATLGSISSRKCLSQLSATAASSHGASDKKRLDSCQTGSIRNLMQQP